MPESRPQPSPELQSAHLVNESPPVRASALRGRAPRAALSRPACQSDRQQKVHEKAEHQRSPHL
eukprot:9627339-Alexandrium_andersonii.AAC.1